LGIIPGICATNIQDLDNIIPLPELLGSPAFRRQGFTAKYNLDKIVFIQEFDTHQEAFQEERRIKRWRRQWKIELIEKKNPQWKDLGVDWE
jgi:hypothetical protein